LYPYTEKKLLEAEAMAKKKRLGMWSIDNVETPMEYKRKLKTLD
jgi:endonuclease YncB( thermonuclease family)